MSVSLKINLIRREEWGALPAKSMEPMNSPIQHVLFSAENEFLHCVTKEECTQKVREIQAFYMNKGMEDIPYSFVVGNDGNVYEGRGWSSKPGPLIQKDPRFKNNPTLDIGVICGHYEVTPEKMDLVRAAFAAAEHFVQHSIKEEKIVKDYEFDGFSDDVKDPAEPTESQKLEADFEDFAVKHPEWFPIMSKEILEKRAKLQKSQATT